MIVVIFILLNKKQSHTKQLSWSLLVSRNLEQILQPTTSTKDRRGETKLNERGKRKNKWKKERKKIEKTKYEEEENKLKKSPSPIPARVCLHGNK